jgi:hypothetical protein
MQQRIGQFHVSVCSRGFAGSEEESLERYGLSGLFNNNHQ